MTDANKELGKMFSDFSYESAYSQSDSLIHVWVVGSDREVARITPQFAITLLPKHKISSALNLADERVYDNGETQEAVDEIIAKLRSLL